MNEICKQNNISEEGLQNMIKNGWVSCSAPQYEKIYVHYKKTQSYQNTCDEFGISKSTLHAIIAKFK